jgi:hypothetical protein
MATAGSSTRGELIAHQRECAQRYKNLEQQLSMGEKRFARLENMVWGLYLILITSSILPLIIK